MFFVFDLDLKGEVSSYLSWLNLTDNSVSSTGIDDRVPVSVILSHLNVSEISAARLFEGLTKL